MTTVSKTELVLLAVTVAVLYALLTVVYRLTWHSLAKYPGPLLASISGWPDGLSACSGDRHIDFHRLHEKYGDVVRFAPDGISFNSPQALHDIYVDRSSNMIKTGWTDAAIAISHVASTHSMPARKQHAVRRRLLSQAFSEKALHNAEAYVLSSIRTWCDYLGGNNDSQGEKTGWSKPRDMGEWSGFLTLDVLGELCFGASFRSMESGNSMIPRLLAARVKQIQSIAYLPVAKFIMPLLGQPKVASLLGGQVGRDGYAYRVQISQMVSKRRGLEQAAEKDPQAARKDFFYYLLRAHDAETGEGLSQAELDAEAALLVAAGMDTSSTTLSAMFFYLSRNQRISKKLSTEIREAFTDVEEIVSGPQLSSLKYLRACVDEVLRITPPVPGILPRKVLSGGAVIDGRRIPAGTVIGVSAYAIHHNETYFPDSFSYIPERWIENSKDAPWPVTHDSLALAKSAFCAFSLGPRGCVGKNMAYMEILLATARLLWLYDLRGVDGALSGSGSEGLGEGRTRKEEYQIWDYFIADRKGPVMQFRNRLPTPALITTS